MRVGATARERRNGERGTGQELTVDSTASSESSGTHWRRWGREDDLRRPELRTTVMEALQGVPACVAQQRGSARGGGALGHDGGARGWRAAGQRTAATGAFGRRGRERERGVERRSREGVRPRGGVVASSRRPRRRGRGGQASSCRGAHARGVRRPRALSLWREEGDDWRWPVSWAGLLGRARPHSARPQVSSLFLFLFLF